MHTEKSPKPRRQTGRWMPEEVEALIEGEHAEGRTRLGWASCAFDLQGVKPLVVILDAATLAGPLPSSRMETSCAQSCAFPPDKYRAGGRLCASPWRRAACGHGSLGSWPGLCAAHCTTGVSLFKTSWAQIYERYVITNKINSKRTQVSAFAAQ